MIGFLEFYNKNTDNNITVWWVYLKRYYTDKKVVVTFDKIQVVLAIVNKIFIVPAAESWLVEE